MVNFVERLEKSRFPFSNQKKRILQELNLSIYIGEPYWL